MIDLISKGRLVSGLSAAAGRSSSRPASTRPSTASASRRRTIWSSRPGRRRGRSAGRARTTSTASSIPGPCHCKSRIRASGSRASCRSETIIWAAKQRYPYVALNTSIEATKKIWELYDAVARETGYEAGPENRGYLQQVHVSDSEEKAERNARQFLWMQGEFTGLAHPVWSSPSGYFSPAAAPPLRRIRGRPGGEPARPADLRAAGRRRPRLLRYPEDGHPEAAPRARRDPAEHLRHLGQ